MTARDEVLARIRTALGEPRPHVAVPREYRQGGPPNPELFSERVADYRATVTRVTDEEVASCLAEVVTGQVVVPAGFPERWLPALPFASDQPPLGVRELDAVDVVVTTCVVGIAETGTVILDHGPGQGRRALTLVPDHHIVVIRTEQIVAGVSDALRRLDPLLPQTWISGPSATSDIELNRVEGVHGPRCLDVILVC